MHCRRPAVVVASAIIAGLASSCLPPPIDLAGTTGGFGVAVERNLTIALADGRVLRADVYRPTDPDGEPAPGPFPVLVGITPYGKSFAAEGSVPGGNGVNLSLVRHGYLAVAVDVPGTGASDGSFDLFDHDEAVAGAAAVRWAADLAGSNGRVGMIGLSYSAIAQLFTAAEIGPRSPLKAIFPMAASVDPYRDLFVSGGALNVLSPFGLLFSYGITRSITPFTELSDDPLAAIAHAAANADRMGSFEAVMAADMFDNGPRRYDGEWWQVRAPERILSRIAANDVAVYLVGGLYDVFQRGEPLLFSGLQNAAAGRPVDRPMPHGAPATDRIQLLTGPWTHGGLGEGPDGIDLTAVQLAWFDRHLKGLTTSSPWISTSGRPLHVIEPGGDHYHTSAYPLPDADVERWWLGPNHALSPTVEGADPAGTPLPSTTGATGDTIDYTPLGPTCTASTVQFAAGLFADECLVPTVRPDAGDGEVLYESAPLTAPMRLGGPVGLTLTATSTTSDTLWSVAIEDVAPDGTASTLTGGAQQGSLRRLDEHRTWTDAQGHLLMAYHRLRADSREPVPIGQPVRYAIELRPVFATLATGHRLRLRVGTADFPHLIPLGDLSRLAGGRYRILHDRAHPSTLDLPVLDRTIAS
ncbi:MAG: CocE/NonD family hydrolase [Microthrixaceae bacterium]